MSESKANLRIERDGLLQRLREAYDRQERTQDEVDRLTQVLLVPTDAMIDAARPIVAYRGSTLNYGEMRRHAQNYGHSLEGWPTWAREAPDNMHINKASMAAIIWGVMAAKALRP